MLWAVPEKDSKFISTKTRNQVVSAQVMPNTLDYLSQQLVPCLVSTRIIDYSQLVDVEYAQGMRSASVVEGLQGAVQMGFQIQSALQFSQHARR